MKMNIVPSKGSADSLTSWIALHDQRENCADTQIQPDSPLYASLQSSL